MALTDNRANTVAATNRSRVSLDLFQRSSDFILDSANIREKIPELKHAVWRTRRVCGLKPAEDT